MSTFLSVYLLRPEPGPVGVNVDPLGEELGPIVVPDGLPGLFGTKAGLFVVEPGALPVVIPFVVDEPGVVPLVAGAPVLVLPPAEPLPVCASANVLDRTKAPVNAIVASFMVVSSIWMIMR
jgi:hypothetical protein